MHPTSSLMTAIYNVSNSFSYVESLKSLKLCFIYLLIFFFLFFYYFKGSDPRAATCRSKLQSKRAKLNQEINKELRLRAGAENLFR